MEIYRSLTDMKSTAAAPQAAIALGFFDGLHLGHRDLILRTVTYAKSHGLSPAVFTFREHPKNIMAGKLSVPRLLLETEKLKLLETLGIDRVYDFDFADGFHTMPPEIFASALLKNAFSAEAVFCGFNFHFGAEAAGNPEMLNTLGANLGFKAHITDPVYVSDKLVSSTLIRHSINDGNMEQATRLLGRDYSLAGIVTKGRGLGRAFGFPTANFHPNPELALPPKGVFITETTADGKTYPSVTNIGTAPTVASSAALRIETHLLESKTDHKLYDKNINVSFKKMLRPERRFESEKALLNQITKDAETTRAFFA